MEPSHAAMQDILAGVFFFFFPLSFLGSATAYVCTMCLQLLAGYTDYVLSFPVVCLYFVCFSFSCAKDSLLCFCHPCYHETAVKCLWQMPRHLLRVWRQHFFVICDLGRGGFCWGPLVGRFPG